MEENMRLENKSAIVTGGGRGIGEAICLNFAKEGADVLVADILGNEAKDVSDKIVSMGRKSTAVELDVTGSARVKGMVDSALSLFGKIDILVNAAGIFISSPLEDIKEEDWDRVIAVNLKGTFLCGQITGKEMIKQKSGNIINISSIAGKAPQISLGAYSPSKAAVLLLTQMMAVEWAKYGIRVNALCPGPTATPMIMDIYNTEKKMKQRTKAIPMNRLASPDEIARAAIYLGSDEAGFVTGSSLVVDGGSVKSMFYLMGQLPADD